MDQNQNKNNAVEFLRLISSGRIDEAYDTHILSTGKHHSPYFAAGFEALKLAMKDNHQHFPDKQSQIKHVLGDGDMVAVHSHVIPTPGDSGFAIVHLFRFEDEKIAELWDFMQSIPSEPLNTDGLF